MVIILLSKLKFTICVCFLSLFCLNLSAFAYNDDCLNINLTCDNLEPVSGEEFTVSLNFLPTKTLNVSAYRIKVHFDSSKVSYKGLFSYINNDDLKTYANGDTLTVLYVTSEKGYNIKANSLQTVLELNFKVLSDCDKNSIKISAVIDGLCDYDAVAIPLPEIEPVVINVVPLEPGNCDLASLSAGQYQLVPSFSSDVTKYSLEVPYSKNTIDFEALPVDENASVNVNRKTLKSAGTSTDINITVTSADKKSKKVYTVTVNRLSKDITSENKTSKKSDKDTPINNLTIDEENTDSFDDAVLDEIFVKNNNVALQNSAAPIVVKENSFNIYVFIAISAIFITIAVLILKHNPNKSGRYSKNS